MNKPLSISEEIINQRTGIHYFNLSCEQNLRDILKETEIKNLLEKFNMTYTINYYDEYFSLLLHKSFDEWMI